MPTELPYGNIQKLMTMSVVLSPASVAATSTAEQTFNLPGVVPGDQVIDVTKPTHQVGLAVIAGRVPAAGQITLVFVNPTASPIVPTASERYSVTVTRPAGTLPGYMS